MDHWVFKKHTKKINNLVEMAEYLREKKSGLTKLDRKKIYEEFSQTDMYNPRKNNGTEIKLDTINHRIDELKFYMFGYSYDGSGKNTFIFSPLGNLFMMHLGDRKKLSKIFVTMLFGVQFPHPYAKPNSKFKIYPFRLIFKLLTDSRLDGKLYNYEIYRYVIYTTSIKPKEYNKLVNTIVESRKKSSEVKIEYLKKNEHSMVTSVYEWDYYVSGILADLRIINLNKGKKVAKLYHPQKPNSKTKTGRYANNGFFSLNSELRELVEILLEEYTIFDEPLDLFSKSEMSSKVIKDIYSFYPRTLLRAIDEPINSEKERVLRLPSLINEYSKYENNKTADKFEDVLLDAFNIFYNVEAEKLSGPGRTDLECEFLDNKEKFTVDAKSTSKKITSLNAGRLRKHRKLVGAKYTIIVTPSYTPSVKYDIEDESIVIIKAGVLSEYLYNNLLMNERNIDYNVIRDVIVKNLGTDVSDKISEITMGNYGSRYVKN